MLSKGLYTTNLVFLYNYNNRDVYQLIVAVSLVTTFRDHCHMLSKL